MPLRAAARRGVSRLTRSPARSVASSRGRPAAPRRRVAGRARRRRRRRRARKEGLGLAARHDFVVPSLVVVAVELGGIAWRESRHGRARASVAAVGGADAAGVAGAAATAPDYADEPGESRLLTTAMKRS